MMLAMLLAAAAASDVCALPAPATVADPATAAAYVEVGDEELASASPATATIAYREALQLDPGNAQARRKYLAACAQDNPAETLRWGRKLLDDGDRDGAIAVLGRLRGSSVAAEAALDEGIARYEQGDDDAARTLFTEAGHAPRLSGRASYFLGLIELRHGEASMAATRFDEVARSDAGSLSDRAAVLRSVARRSGRASLSVFAESGYDSNVTYQPDGMPASADGAGGAGLGLSLRPFGIAGPYLRADGFYRRQFQFNDRDFGDAGGLVGYRVGSGDQHAFAEYGFDASFLGGATYLLAHRARAGGRWQIRRVGFAAIYAARFGSFKMAFAAPYSGVLQTLDPEVSLRFPLGSTLSAGYHAGRDSTDFASTTSWEHGPRAAARLVILPTLRVLAETGLLLRNYDGPATSGGTARSDTVLYAGASAEMDFADRLTLRLSGGDRAASSSDPAFSYVRATALLSVSYTVGLF